MAQELALAKSREAADLQEELVNQLIENEPDLDEEGEPPVVTFVKRFPGGGRYTYAAIGIPITSAQDVYELDWYVTSSQRQKAYTWAELVRFMGFEGLSTLEVLRAG